MYAGHLLQTQWYPISWAQSLCEKDERTTYSLRITRIHFTLFLLQVKPRSSKISTTVSVVNKDEYIKFRKETTIAELRFKFFADHIYTPVVQWTLLLLLTYLLKLTRRLADLTAERCETWSSLWFASHGSCRRGQDCCPFHGRESPQTRRLQRPSWPQLQPAVCHCRSYWPGARSLWTANPAPDDQPTWCTTSRHLQPSPSTG